MVNTRPPAIPPYIYSSRTLYVPTRQGQTVGSTPARDTANCKGLLSSHHARNTTLVLPRLDARTCRETWHGVCLCTRARTFAIGSRREYTHVHVNSFSSLETDHPLIYVSANHIHHLYHHSTISVILMGEFAKFRFCTFLRAVQNQWSSKSDLRFPSSNLVPPLH